MDVVVQPSVPWMSLNDQIKDSGLFFPVDPGPSVSASVTAANRISDFRIGHSGYLLTKFISSARRQEDSALPGAIPAGTWRHDLTAFSKMSFLSLQAQLTSIVAHAMCKTKVVEHRKQY